MEIDKSNEIIKLAQDLKGEIQEMQGTLYGLKPSSDGKGFYIIGLPFWGLDDMARVKRAAERLNVQPIDIKEIIPRVEQSTISLIPKAPPKSHTCKYHGGEMKEGKKPGQWFCPKKIPGGYCDYTIQD